MASENRRDKYEVIGLAAVVASLLFVALELRQANLASRIAARDSATQGHLDFMGSLIDPSVLAIANSKYLNGEELTPLEQSQMDANLWRRLKHYERVFYLYQDGVLSNSEWEGFQRSLMVSLIDASPRYRLQRESWEKNKGQLSVEFVEHVEDRLTQQ